VETKVIKVGRKRLNFAKTSSMSLDISSNSILPLKPIARPLELPWNLNQKITLIKQDLDVSRFKGVGHKYITVSGFRMVIATLHLHV